MTDGDSSLTSTTLPKRRNTRQKVQTPAGLCQTRRSKALKGGSFKEDMPLQACARKRLRASGQACSINPFLGLFWKDGKLRKDPRQLTWPLQRIPHHPMQIGVKDLYVLGPWGLPSFLCESYRLGLHLVQSWSCVMCVKFGHVITVPLISPRRSLALSLRNVMNLQFRLNLWSVKSISSSPRLSPLSTVAVFRQLIIPMSSQRLRQNECETLFFYEAEYLALNPCGARTCRMGDPSMANTVQPCAHKTAGRA